MIDFLTKYKAQKKLSNNCQLILMDSNGQLKASCNTLFPTEPLKNVSLFQWSPFLESIFAYLQQINVKGPFEFKCVQDNHDHFSGFYDYRFLSIKVKGKQFILWEMTDKTTDYTAKQAIQQKDHNRDLRGE